MACVLVHIEADGDLPTPASLAALGEGRRVASSSGATLYAAVVVNGELSHARRDEILGELGRHGADKVVFISSATPPEPVLWATVGHALVAASEHLRPALTLLPASAGSHDLGARLATRLGAAYVEGPALEQGPRGEIVLSRPVYGGAWRRRTSLDDLDRAVVVTLPPGRRPATGLDDAEVLFLEARTSADAKVKLLGQDQDDGAALTRAPIVVAAGGGVNAKSWALAEDLARALGAELGATRVLIRRGVAPQSREIGVGARHVSPVLYVVLGASGSPGHMGAVSPDSEIVAIDRDPDAPIFKVASYGIVGTIEDVVPRLIAQLKGEAA
jgi:electron transfer flavoprotein alpha subunit